MDRLNIKKKYVGREVKLSPSQTLVFSKYMTDSEYKYAIKHFKKFFVKPRKLKDDNTEQ